MKMLGRSLLVAVGLLLGGVGSALYFGLTRPAEAANDRAEDFIICTGSVSVSPHIPSDGIWLLDYRAGKLLGTIVDRNFGKTVGWAEVDLVNEFAIQPKQNVHFMMTTGAVSKNQAALYVAETTTGKFGVYTMGPRTDGVPGVIIRRHDLSLFRRPPPS
jgi:hypothetical protein